MTNSTYLVIGKNGKTGSRVESRLMQAGLETLGVSRSTTPSFDWSDAGNWSAVLRDVRAAYVTYHPDLSEPEAEGRIRLFAEIARQAGVEHIVLLSGRGEEGALKAEKALQDCAVDWNIVRASWFAQNFSENFMLDGILAGELVLPDCAATEPFIDIDDIADVVTAALMEPGLRNRIFEVTGPESISFADCVGLISEATGYPVQLTQVPLPDYLSALEAEGVPEDIRRLLEELFTILFDGRNESPANGVLEALGRRATDFSSYAAKTAATGVWKRNVGSVA